MGLLAGPFSNLLMAILAAVPFRMGLVSVYYGLTNYAGDFTYSYPRFFRVYLINLLLCLFNLIPLAPLDGEKILDYFLPPTSGQSDLKISALMDR